MYMIDRSSIYLVSSDGEFFWFSLDDDLQLRLQSVSKLNVYNCLIQKKQTNSLYSQQHFALHDDCIQLYFLYII